MQTPRLLPASFLALALVAATAAASHAAPFITETFDQSPDPLFWKARSASVSGGLLLLHVGGDETTFVNSSIETLEPQARLDFSRATVTLSLADLVMDGQAPAERQAFVVLLGSDKKSEAATGYVRLIFNGDGKVGLSTAGPKKDGRTTDRGLLSRNVVYPVKQVSLSLNREGYELKITDSVAPLAITGKWDPAFDWSAWENSAPQLIIKGVRRPGPGTIEATLGAFSIETK